MKIMNNNDFNRKNFLGYIKNPMTKEDMDLLYKNNNIILEKCELFSDFSQSLLMTVFETYMGDDVTDLRNQVLHFNWCWNRTIDNFIDEGLDFEGNTLYEYFLHFTLEVYYTTPNKKEVNGLEEKIIKLWLDIFDYHKDKTNSDMDALIEIYIIFENSLKIF